MKQKKRILSNVDSLLNLHRRRDISLGTKIIAVNSLIIIFGATQNEFISIMQQRIMDERGFGINGKKPGWKTYLKKQIMGQ